MGNGTVLIAFNSLMGIFLPKIVDVVINRKDSKLKKMIIGLLISFLFSAITIIIMFLYDNDISINSWLGAIAICIISTEKSYILYWKDKLN